MNNNLILLNEYMKRLRTLKYGFHTLIPGTLMNLYDTNLDDNRAYHHILTYSEDVWLFQYPILLTASIAKKIGDYIKEVETARKAEKIKPKDVTIQYVIKEYDTHIDVVLFTEGLTIHNSMIKIDLIKDDSMFYKNQLDILSRIKIVCPEVREIVEYTVDPSLYTIMSETEDIITFKLEIGENKVPYPLAASLYFGLRKAPQNMTIEIANTKNVNIFMVTLNYDTDKYKEKHISFVLHR